MATAPIFPSEEGMEVKMKRKLAIGIPWFWLSIIVVGLAAILVYVMAWWVLVPIGAGGLAGITLWWAENNKEAK